MEDTGTPNPLSRRKSIAGPFMRSSTGIPVPPNQRSSTSASSSAQSTPAPLLRANTVSGGGWFGGWFSRGSRASISQSTGIPKTSVDDSDLDNRAHLAASAPGGVPPPKGDSRELMNPTESVPKTGSGNGTSTAGKMPPVHRRLSEAALKRPAGAVVTFASTTTGGTDGEGAAPTAPAAGSPAASLAKKPSILETDLRQPIENDLFWTVLREIGE